MPRSTKRICIYAMGIALFVALTMCLQVPVFENYYLCLGYAVMAVYCYSFGAAAGALVGSMGVVLYCLLTSGLRGMPGWALGNLVIGLILGATFQKTKHWKGIPFWTANGLAVVTATAAGVLAVKSAVEFILYGQPFFFRVVKNGYAFTADVIVLLIGLAVCVKLDPKLVKWTEEAA